ncbi:hypothetical protein HZ326_3678, partial [Fusarium oxysporum f. sp. albedinis]
MFKLKYADTLTGGGEGVIHLAVRWSAGAPR